MNLGTKIAAYALPVIGAIGLLKSTYTLEPHQDALVKFAGVPSHVVVNQRSDDEVEVLRTKYAEDDISISTGAGLHWKKPWESVEMYSNALQRWEAVGGEIQTKDKRYLSIDSTALWKISDPIAFQREARTIATGEAKISTMLNSSTGNQLRKNSLPSVIRTDNTILSRYRPGQETDSETGLPVPTSGYQLQRIDEAHSRIHIKLDIVDEAQPDLDQFGIKLHPEGFSFVDVSYGMQTKRNIEGRMIQERQAMTEQIMSEAEAEYVRITSEADEKVRKQVSSGKKAAEETVAKARQEAFGMYTDAWQTSPELFKLLQNMELLDQTFSPTNGAEKTLILDQDSLLYKALNGQ